MKNKKALVLAAAMLSGMLFQSSCFSFKDFRRAFYAGTLDFAEAYTFNTLDAVVPGVDEFLNDDAE